MKAIVKIFMFCFPIFLFGQTSYHIEGGTVIFEFDAEDLDSLFAEPFCLIQDFDSLKLTRAIANPSTGIRLDHNWNLYHVKNSVYQLRKSLDDFDDAMNPWDKYMILREYWNYPTSQVSNLGDSDSSPYKISEEGNTFFLSGHQSANKVILSGNFNGWDEQELRMNKVANGWELTLALKAGIYEYKFIVDGNWTHDLSNPLKLVNEHDTFNSILLVGKTVVINFKQKANSTSKVYLSGSFNNWDELSLPMQKNGDVFSIDLPLPPGKHYYKFIVDNQWMTDPSNDLIEIDDKGYQNSVLLVN